MSFSTNFPAKHRRGNQKEFKKNDWMNSTEDWKNSRRHIILSQNEIKRQSEEMLNFYVVEFNEAFFTVKRQGVVWPR